MKCRPVMFVCVLVLAGCGTQGSATVKGTIDGAELDGAGAYSVRVGLPGDAENACKQLFIASRSDACSYFGDNPLLASGDSKGSQIFSFLFNASHAKVVGPGTYVVQKDQGSCTDVSGQPGDDLRVFVDYYSAAGGPDCTVGDLFHGLSGSVTVTASTSAGMSGTFDITFGNPNNPGGASAEVTGTFDAPVCSPPSGSAGKCH